MYFISIPYHLKFSLLLFFSYRRGKSLSSDVDIIFSHPDLRNGADLVKGLCAKLTNRLHSLGEYRLFTPSALAII